jgi:hypothetical protein
MRKMLLAAFLGFRATLGIGMGQPISCPRGRRSGPAPMTNTAIRVFSAHLLKSTDPKDLAEAIRRVHAGRLFSLTT